MPPLLVFLAMLLLTCSQSRADEPRLLIDTHIHYSQDAWSQLPPPEAVKVLRQAGLKKAFVSSSSDDGTQMLRQEAPDLIVPVLRPYRSRGDIGTWLRDEAVVAHVEARLQAQTYAGIGEFHVYGADADLPVLRRMVQLARQYGIFLHAHADSEAVERIFAQDPEARVLWAHAGFAPAEQVRSMLAKYNHLWCDLAFRSEHATGGQVDPQWHRLFVEFPRRFMLGTDTYTPERWYYVVEHATSSRQWLRSLPAELADNLAFRNAEALAAWALKR